MLNIHATKEQKDTQGAITGITISNIGYTRVIRMTFLLKQELRNRLLSQNQKRQEKREDTFLNNLFQEMINKVEMWGYQSNCSPPASMVPQLLNISHLFKKYSREEESHEADILLGLSLINARRFTQAT